MSKDKSSVKWTGKMAFETHVSGHTFFIDADEKVGGEDKGPRPKALMLSSLAGCTAMDVISILRKMRVEPDIEHFAVHADGDVTEEHPKHFYKIHLTFEFTAKQGKTLPLDKIEKAINLSEDRYCGVSYSYKQVMEMSHEIKIN
ncbi:MAG: OsmC family protein [Bacteroidales bacterium]|nr:OsmC family protein [Bacteroidales bacterium]